MELVEVARQNNLIIFADEIYDKILYDDVAHTSICTLCDDVLKSHMADLIMAESDEDFAAIQEDMLKEIEELGEPACWDWYNTKWEEAREIVQPYFDAACEAAGLK